MRFVLECEVCRRNIREVMDDSYAILVSYRRFDVCDKCKENLKKLEKKK